MNLEISPAAQAEATILSGLLDLYAHELSAIANLPIAAGTPFQYEPLPRYWAEAHHYPYLVRVDGELAGFVLVQQGSRLTKAPDVWDVAEFFVVKRYRKRGIGQRVAHSIWRQHAGRWEVRVMERNTAADGFWRRAIEAYVGLPVEPELVRVGDKSWNVFRVTSENLS